MKYIGITQDTAAWLLSQPDLRELLQKLLSVPERLSGLTSGQMAEGALRMAATPDATVLTIWNTDYLGNTGEEPWGFFKLSTPFGLLDSPTTLNQTFERCLYIINQRLQALLIDSAYFHKTWAEGVQTVLSGRGEDARQQSLAYIEKDSNAAQTCAVY